MLFLKNKFYFLHNLVLILCTTSVIQPFTIMIDPSGDAKHTGRVIQDTFERGITLQCAESLKKELNAIIPDVRVVLSRVPGETIQPLQNASFANRLQADFYISISFYLETNIPPHIAIYQYVTTPTDFWHKYSSLCFYHVSQAHLINIELATKLGKKLLQILQNNTINNFFMPQGLFAIPYKSLMGIKAPALAIEAGIAQKDDFKHIIKPLIAFIKEIAT